jgi:hypothetical protein
MPYQPLDLVSADVAAAAAPPEALTPRLARAATASDDLDMLAATDREHIEREIAAIERASAVLRRAEPKLESWIDAPSAGQPKPRPVWLLIGALWLSTALVTVGAAFAITVLVG